PDGVNTIGKCAFDYCESLTEITIPDSVKKIGKNAFDWCTNLTIYASADSYAKKYAKIEDVPFKAL
ncbi:MAG: leucine-rich repeat protein, partial [Clostridia bacterium]|nr:leucine-rich repeat protein [Clostridia bacterium]